MGPRHLVFPLLAWCNNPHVNLLVLPWLNHLFGPGDAGTLATRPEWQARWLAASYLGARAAREPAAQALLLALAEDGERFVREGAARALATWLQAAPSDASRLADLLGDSSNSPRLRRTILLAAAALIRDAEAPLEPALVLLERAAALPSDDVVYRTLPQVLQDLSQRAPEAARRLQARPWPEDWQTTAEIPIPASTLDQVIGQPQAVDVVRLAAHQRRFVLLVGEPGTGKSMLAAAMAEHLPAETLQDIILWPNPEQPISPRVQAVACGQGKSTISAAQARIRQAQVIHHYLLAIVVLAMLTAGVAGLIARDWRWPLLSGVLLLLLLVGRQRANRLEARVPRLLVRQHPRHAPFVDATGFHAGALLGDVRHDPFQSGGRETPPHHLVEAGAIHQAHGGVLFIDEAGTLSIESQQSLLTAIQMKQMPISGRSPGSSGSMVRTEPVPCDIVLVLAGNHEDVAGLHPALRSRVRGYGYEVLMATEMPDTPENRRALARFVAQEVVKDGRIPHFTRAAVGEIIAEAARRAPAGRLTVRLRELGGLVRAAGDQAVADGAPLATAEHVQRAVDLAHSLEEQIAFRTAHRAD